MVRDILKKAAERLAFSDTPMLDARVLLASVAGKEDASLIFDTPDDDTLKIFEEYVEKRAMGVPVAYILGEKEFMGFKFTLNEDTLIPRPDTECLVEKVIEKSTFPSPKILDLCTGSGCIGISLTKLIKGAQCDLTDISDGALSAARNNAAINSVDTLTRVFKLDLLNDEIPGGYDIIVSNPPYIESGIVPTLEVSSYEPHRALDGGEDGLLFYRIIAKNAYDALPDGGMLALEIGYDQRESVSALLGAFSSIETFKDYGGNDRVIIAVK